MQTNMSSDPDYLRPLLMKLERDYHVAALSAPSWASGNVNHPEATKQLQKSTDTQHTQ